MRKFYNNHFGQSRIFGKARFAVEPDGGAILENGSDASFDSDNVAGGGTPSADNKADEASEGKDDEVGSLKAELAKYKADNERFKNSINKLSKENGELTKKNREMMSADQLEKEAQEERDRRFAEMEKELRTNKYSKRLVGVGMTEQEADTFAATMPEFEDADSFFDTLGKFVKAREKEAATKAIQDLLKSRPDIHAGNGDSDKDDPAMALAKQAVDRRGANFGKADDSIINYYKR